MDSYDEIVERQLLDNILDRGRSRLDRILDRTRTTTTTTPPPPPAETTRAQDPPPQQEAPQPPPPPPPPPPPQPTTTPPSRPQPTTPRAEAPPTPTPDNTPRPAPVPAPAPTPSPKPEPQPEPQPEPKPEPEPVRSPAGTTSQVVKPDPQPSRRPGEAVQTVIHPEQPPISRPPQEEVHQPLPTGGPDASPTYDEGPFSEIAPGLGTSTRSNGGGSHPTNELPGLVDADRGNSPGGGGGGDGSKRLDLTQSLALGFGLTLFVIIIVGLFFFIRRCLHKRRQRRAAFGHFNVPPSHPNMAEARGPPPFPCPPPHDPEAGLRHHHEQQQFHNNVNTQTHQPTVPPNLPYAGENTSQFDRQASTAAWAHHVPPPPPEPEEETGIIKIFRWPTMSARSAKSVRTTASGPAGDVSRSQSGKDTSSRASRSTISTMLFRSRKSIARRKAEARLEGDTDRQEDEVRMLPDPESRAPSVDPTLLPRPLHIAHTLKAEQRDVAREPSKSKPQKRMSTLTISSVGGRSIASSNVLSPTLMSFPVPPTSTSGGSSLSCMAMGDRESLPPLPATVYKPYRPER